MLESLKKEGTMKTNLNKLVLSGLLIAIIFVVTLFVKVPTPQGYIHAGDGFVLLSGMILGPLLGSLVSGIGSALADLQAGYIPYIPATFIIKMIMALIASKAIHRRKGQVLFLFILSELIMVVGYFVFEWILLSSYQAAIPQVPLNLIQAAFGVVVASVLFFALSKRMKWDKDHTDL